MGFCVFTKEKEERAETVWYKTAMMSKMKGKMKRKNGTRGYKCKTKKKKKESERVRKRESE